MKLDTVTLVETPEGIDLQAEVAGVVPRGLAFSVDLLIRFAIMTVCGIVLGLSGKAGMGLYLILYFVLEWWYPVLFEIYRGGQTWGKQIFNIKVVNDDLTPIRFGASMTRNLLRTADFFPFLYVFGIVSMVFTKRFQRLGDLAAGTIVVYCEEESVALHSLEKIATVTPLYKFNQEQQMAFMNFTLNRNQLSTDRQQEIAEILRPIIPANVSSDSEYVRGVGKWLLGAK